MFCVCHTNYVMQRMSHDCFLQSITANFLQDLNFQFKAATITVTPRQLPRNNLNFKCLHTVANLTNTSYYSKIIVGTLNFFHHSVCKILYGNSLFTNSCYIPIFNHVLLICRKVLTNHPNIYLVSDALPLVNLVVARVYLLKTYYSFIRQC